MLAHHIGLFTRATLVALLLVIGVSHAAVGEQYLDPGWVFGAATARAAATAPVAVTVPAPAHREAHWAAVGQAHLDPGPSSSTSNVAALTIEQEMVYLRAEIRKLAHDKAVGALTQQQTSSALISDAATTGSTSFAQRLIWLQPIGACMTWSPPLLWPGGSILTAARREFCIGINA